MDVCGGIPEFAQQSLCCWISTFQTNLFSPQTQPEKGKDWPNAQNCKKRILLESSICKALRWVLASEKFGRRAGKLKSTYRKPLLGNNGGRESGEGKNTSQTPGETWCNQWDPGAKLTPLVVLIDEQSSSSATAVSSPLGKGPRGPTLYLISRKGKPFEVS